MVFSNNSRAALVGDIGLLNQERVHELRMSERGWGGTWTRGRSMKQKGSGKEAYKELERKNQGEKPGVTLMSKAREEPISNKIWNKKARVQDYKVKAEDCFHKGPCGRGRELHNLLYNQRADGPKMNKIDHMARRLEGDRSRPWEYMSVTKSLDFIAKMKAKPLGVFSSKDDDTVRVSVEQTAG